MNGGRTSLASWAVHEQSLGDFAQWDSGSPLSAAARRRAWALMIALAGAIIALGLLVHDGSWQRGGSPSLLASGLGAANAASYPQNMPAQPLPEPEPKPTITNPEAPTKPDAPTQPWLEINIGGEGQTPSTAVLVLIGMTLLSVAPSLLLMMSSFTKIFITLAMTRNAVGLQQIPPNQVLAGLALFLSLFIMSPVISDINEAAIVPYTQGKTSFREAMSDAYPPLRDFMLKHTREEDLALITRAADRPNPATLEDVPFSTLVPAFVMSELRSAFIIGFVIFIPFLVIDLVVAASLMSMGMMMLPPVMVSLPFKILLFVMVDGWGLILQTLIGTYR